jgi:hypothetical protein
MCGVVELTRVLERYRDVGTVNWGALFQALVVPTLTFWIVRLADRQMMAGQRIDASVAAHAQRTECGEVLARLDRSSTG